MESLVEFQRRSILFDLEQTYKLSRDIIERNIKPYAAELFEDLIETVGNVEGPNVLKKILTLRLGSLSEREFNEAAELIKVLVVPHQSLFQSTSRFKNSFARAIFALILLRKLQEHYIQIENSSATEFAQLEWIPSWTKKFSGMIYEETISKGNDQKYTVTKYCLVALVGFLAFYAYNSAEYDQNFKILKYFTLTLALMAIVNAISETLVHPLKIYLNRKTDEYRYGPAIEEICALTNKIASSKFKNSPSSDDYDNTMARMLYDRNVVI